MLFAPTVEARKQALRETQAEWFRFLAPEWMSNIYLGQKFLNGTIRVYFGGKTVPSARLIFLIIPAKNFEFNGIFPLSHTRGKFLLVHLSTGATENYPR